LVEIRVETADISAGERGRPKDILLHRREVEDPSEVSWIYRLISYRRTISDESYQDNRSEPLLALTVATIQSSETSTKQTNVDVQIQHAVAHTVGIASWIHDIRQTLKTPPGVS
jgi:hypothetical protein